jgi:hypothetical protein
MPDDLTDTRRFQYLGQTFTATRARSHAECPSCNHTETLVIVGAETQQRLSGSTAGLVWHAITSALRQNGLPPTDFLL